MGHRERTRRARWALLVSVGAAVLFAGACTPTLVPPPKPPPSTSGPNPDLAPRADDAAYVGSGPFAAGVRTVEVEKGRKAEVWYPAAPDSTTGLEPDTYHIKDFLAPFLVSLIPASVNPAFTTTAFRDVPVAPGGPFPLVLFSHGAASYRLQSTFLTAHLASWGFVVVSPDYFERGLQSLLGVPPSPPHTDDRIVQLTVDAMAAANAAGPLAGAVDMSRLFPVGHSAGGGTSTRLGWSRTDVQSWISLAGGIRPTSQIVPVSLRDPSKAALWIGGATDGVASPVSLQDAFDYTAGPRKLVFIPGAGHNNAFSDICEIGREFGGVVGIARTIGLPVPDFVLNLGSDGCTPGWWRLSEEVWPVTRHFVTAELRYRAGLDTEPVGLGAGVVDQFDAPAPTYRHDP